MRELVPSAEIDSLEKWGNRPHREEGGHELAGKVISFVERVTAAPAGDEASSR